ncbi:hypothetical protein GK2055 [Geobacillus kaustophilus HTA426]|uniref:Uncharacterized protein n=1 Tax=Geobacillus kaustophilus (strain HTA426) TaxID=235909 RepID=Q5KY96_GEOKA|nr:hypothetical protein GK2055 [Geobacillus kaustophilus HTA426]
MRECNTVIAVFPIAGFADAAKAVRRWGAGSACPHLAFSLTSLIGKGVDVSDGRTHVFGSHQRGLFRVRGSDVGSRSGSGGKTNDPAFLFFFGQKCLFVLAGQALLLL